MEQCEVMLRDMADSKRADTAIHQQLANAAPQEPTIAATDFNATIVSPLFWPSFREEALVLHPVVQQYEPHTHTHTHLHRTHYALLLLNCT